MPVIMAALLFVIVSLTRGRLLNCLAHVAIPACVWHDLWLDWEFITWRLVQGALVTGTPVVKLWFVRR